MITEIKQQKLRYIVPFAVDWKGQSFEEFCKTLVKPEGGTWCYEPPKEGEQDIYGLFQDALRQDRPGHENIGVSLVYCKKEEKSILSLNYLRGEQLPEWRLGMTEAGMYLFRTGIGLFWYELDWEEKPEDDSAEELILFQNRVKELNRAQFPYYDVKNPVWGEDGRLQPNYVAEIILENGDFDFGVGADGSDTLGRWITKLLSFPGCEAKFYPDRAYCKDKELRVPDKALLFTYLLADAESGADMTEAAYYLASGYNRSYEPATDIAESMYRPFAGADWYVTREGCGYFVKNRPESEYFFTNFMPRKLANDYFTLYITLLYQTYTLLHFANRIEREMSADYHTYKEPTEQVADRLESFEAEINVFLMKSVYASVSHIQHQNGFYEYATKQLRIREDVESLTMGLRFLDEFQQQRKSKKEAEQEEKLSNALGVLSLLTILSAFMDGFSLVDQMTLYFRGTGWTPVDYVTHIGVFLLVLIISFFAVKSVSKAIIHMLKHQKGKKSS